MLSNITKQKSLIILQVFATIFMLSIPSALGEMPKSTGIFVLLIICSCVLWMRIKSTQKVDLSVSHFAYLLLAVYSAITSFWASNREGNLLFFFSALVLMIFHTLSYDYFAENKTDNIKRRAMYLFSISGLICAIINLTYWIGKIVPVAGKTPLSKGLVTNDFLAIFLYFSIMATLLLLKGNSKLRRILLVLVAVAKIFVFVLAKSSIGWIFAILFTILLFAKQKGQKVFVIASIVGVVTFFISSVVWLTNSAFSNAFSEVLGFATKNFFGAGGGFWTARGTFMTLTKSNLPQVGLFAYLFASSGFIGALVSVFLIIKNFVIFLRLKNTTSLASLFLCVLITLLPFGENIAVLLLAIGLTSYNEQLAGLEIKLELNGEVIKKISYGTISVLVISTLLFAHSIIRTSANNAYNKEDYVSAYSLYKIAGTLNVCDSESLRMATTSLRKSGEIAFSYDVAVETIDKAIKRDKNNLENILEKALLYDACGTYELSAQQYRNAVQKAYNKDEYNLLLSKELFKIVKKSPKGSAETKRAYEEIIKIAQTTESLDYRKEINDIADKAFKYTKGEIVSEG